jgi:SAM-dependent methyltransferase
MMRKIVLWGHGVKDYQEMFDLTQADLRKKILEFGCGATAFNAQLHHINSSLISCDPLFNLNGEDLRTEVDKTLAEMEERVIKDQDKFNFQQYGGLANLVNERKEGMEQFFADYEKGGQEGRYRDMSSQEELPFADFYFDLALSSHFLFSAMDTKNVDYYLKIIKELARVAKEVRIFPLVDRFGDLSPFVGPVLLGLQQENYGVEIREVPYHLQHNGNAMLRVWAQQCSVN